MPKWGKQPQNLTQINMGNPLAADLFECINFVAPVEMVTGIMPTQVGFAPFVASPYGMGQKAVNDTNYIRAGNSTAKWLGSNSGGIGGLKTWRFCFVTPATVALFNTVAARNNGGYATGEFLLTLNASWQTDAFSQWNQVTLGAGVNLGLGPSAYQELVIVTAGTPGSTSQTMSIYNRGLLITTISGVRWDAANNSTIAQWYIGSLGGASGFGTSGILPLQMQTWKNTSLSAAQVAQLAADSWQLFAPLRARSFFGPAAGVADILWAQSCL